MIILVNRNKNVIFGIFVEIPKKVFLIEFTAIAEKRRMKWNVKISNTNSHIFNNILRPCSTLFLKSEKNKHFNNCRE